MSPSKFYELGKQLALTESTDSTRLSFTVEEFQDVCDFLPETTKAVYAAKKEFEEGWRNGQSERLQVESFIQAAVQRKMNEKTLQMIAGERRRVAESIFKH